MMSGTLEGVSPSCKEAGGAGRGAAAAAGVGRTRGRAAAAVVGGGAGLARGSGAPGPRSGCGPDRSGWVVEGVDQDRARGGVGRGDGRAPWAMTGTRRRAATWVTPATP